jgi:lipopolysaccharide transport system ATP-binding protein
MSGTIVSIDGLGKRYALRQRRDQAGYLTLRDSLAAWLRSPFGHLRSGVDRTSGTDDFWALRDVSFEVSAGDVVGVIGRNGAGKSTLLKILSRITEPSEGRVVLGGRAASLLEVGTGFHPELTGRENIYLNGAILGMTRAEIRRNFDSIVDFAEVAQFLDTPVKRYSSGMYVRLAFAVAAHLQPDILVVDEVLAVGDAEFQKKSLGKMHEVSRGGRTVLFVSHNMAAVQALCRSAVWLDRGRVAATGPTADVIGKYLHGVQSVDRGLVGPTPIGQVLQLRTFAITPNPVRSGDRVDFTLTLGATESAKVSEVAILFYSALEMRVAIVDLRAVGLPARVDNESAWTVSGTISRLNLVEGDYRLGLFVNSSDYVGDVGDLLELTVHARDRAGQHAPYAAAHRGVVEFEVEVHQP